MMHPPDPHGLTGNQNARKPDDEKEDSHLHIRCNARDKSSWVRAAQFDPRNPGSKLAEWVKRTLNHAAKRTPQHPGRD